MDISLPSSQIQLMPMRQLAEVLDCEDDWTGITDAASRRKRQNRLNVRAYLAGTCIPRTLEDVTWNNLISSSEPLNSGYVFTEEGFYVGVFCHPDGTYYSLGRRKALQSQAAPTSASILESSVNKTESPVPCWIEDQQMVSNLPASVVKALHKTGSPLIPRRATAIDLDKSKKPASIRIIFPLSSDHLITLLQYNVLRAFAVNRRLLSPLLSVFDSECGSEALQILPSPSMPKSLPRSLHPTELQRTVPHEEWIDIFPHPRFRDNLILSIGTFDEEWVLLERELIHCEKKHADSAFPSSELWSDTLGGLFEGFPASEIEQRGVIAWSPPWDFGGWEVTDGFVRKWGWLLQSCEDVLEPTNRWRRMRGEDPLSLDSLVTECMSFTLQS